MDEIARCEGDWWYYLTTYWKTIDKDTGKIKLFATFDDKYDIPEYREFIKWFLGEVYKRVRARRQIEKPDIADEKSRQMYLTNGVSGLTGYLLQFYPNFRGLFTHEKEEKMDKLGDFNTPFGMIDFGLEHQPNFLKTDKSDLIRSHMRIGLKSIKTLLIGDAGVRPGAGGGFDLIYNTEFAHQSNTNQKLAAEREACKGVNILDSTPNGKYNAHAITCEFAEKHPDKSSFLYVPIHWSKRRIKDWYDIKKLDYNGDDAQIAQELDMSREGSVLGRAFKLFKPSDRIDVDFLKFKPALSINGFDFGWVHYTAAVFIAPWVNDTWIVYDEYMDNEKPIHVHAGKCMDIIRRWGVTNARWIADPSGTSRSREQGKSFYELYQSNEISIENRLQFEPGDNAVTEGISAINTMFWKDKLFISNKCVNLIDALNEAVYPTNKNNEPTSDKYKEDWYTDILDALRYAVSRLTKYTAIAARGQDRPRPLIHKGLGVGNLGRR